MIKWQYVFQSDQKYNHTIRTVEALLVTTNSCSDSTVTIKSFIHTKCIYNNMIAIRWQSAHNKYRLLSYINSYCFLIVQLLTLYSIHIIWQYRVCSNNGGLIDKREFKLWQSLDVYNCKPDKLWGFLSVQSISL